MELSDKEQLYYRYPTLLETENNSNSFIGIFTNYNDEVYRLSVTAPNFPETKNLTIKVHQGVNFDCVNINTLVSEPTTNDNIFNYLECLINKLNKYNFNSVKAENLNENKIIFLLKQVEQLDLKSYKASIKQDYSEIRIDNFINYDHNHYINILIKSNLIFIVNEHSLPEITKTMFEHKQSNLIDIITLFIEYLHQLDEFYINMNTIDELCYVVEPSIATTKSTYRIFKLNDKVFIKIIVDPISPSCITINFIGPTSDVEPLRSKYDDQINEWDIDLDIYKNLLRIFDLMYFPMKTNNELDEHDKRTCNICYSYHLENQIPLITCDNTICDMIFHIKCLKKWFSTLVESKTFFAVTLGSCPFCKTKLSTTFTQLLDIQNEKN